MKQTAFLIALLFVGLVPVQAHALPRGISRANCLFRNESITWDNPWTYRWYWTDSAHYYQGIWQHTVTTYWRYGAYATAGDWESSFLGGLWSVGGAHYYWGPDAFGSYRKRLIGYTYTTHCEPFSW
jgi:hypothetical protein